MYQITKNKYEDEEALKDEDNLNKGDYDADVNIISLILDRIIINLIVSYDFKKRHLTTQKVSAILAT